MTSAARSAILSSCSQRRGWVRRTTFIGFFRVPRRDVNPPLPEVLELDTLLLVPTAEDVNVGVPEHEVIELEDDLPVEILWTRLTDGRTALLAFTSEDELREWKAEGGPYIGLEAREVARMAFEGGADVVYVNPSNRDGKVFVVRPEDLPAVG
jgi:SseB protein N-terminal domain